MASNITAQSVLKEIGQSHLECPICSDSYKQPKLLDCFHSFCLECLQQLREKNSPRSTKLTCPVCRHETALKQNDLNGLQTDFKSISLLENLQEQERQLNSQQEQHPSNQEYVSKCRQHKDKELILYCDTCRKLMCTTCIANDHRRHTAMELNQALQKCQSNANELLRKLSQSIMNFKTVIHESDMTRITLDSMFAATKEKISKKTDKEIAKEVARIKGEQQKLMQEAEQTYQDRAKTMEDARAKNCIEMSKAEQKQDKVNQIVNQDSCHNIIHLIENFLLNLTEYPFTTPQSVSQKLTYIDLKEGQKSLGRLVLQNRWALKEIIRKYMDTKQQMVKFSPSDIASYSNSDIVASGSISASLITISAESYPQSTVMARALSIEGLTIPSRIIVNKNDGLIVLDNTEVKFFNRRNQLIHQFTLGAWKAFKQPSCIAVDDNNLIAVGYRNKKRISLHNQVGSLIRTLPAPGIGEHLTIYKQHLIYTNLGDKKLVSVDYSGLVVFSVDTMEPHGVCCDKDGNIYVAVERRGFSAGEIQQYSPDGKYIGCIIKDCAHPWRITITPAGDLVLAAYKSVRIYHHGV